MRTTLNAPFWGFFDTTKHTYYLNALNGIPSKGEDQIYSFELFASDSTHNDLIYSY